MPLTNKQGLILMAAIASAVTVLVFTIWLNHTLNGGADQSGRHNEGWIGRVEKIYVTPRGGSTYMDIRKENGKRETLRFYSDENLILDSLDVGDSIELFKYSDSMATKQHNSSLWVIFSKSQGLR